MSDLFCAAGLGGRGVAPRRRGDPPERAPTRRPRKPWLALLASAVLVLAACGDSSPPGSGDSGADGSGDATVSGTGGGEFTGLTALGQKVSSPFDATPDPEGNKVYYTAILPAADEASDPQGALFVVESGKAPVMLAKGFVSPVSLVVSTDGSTIFIADAGNDGAADSTTEVAAGVVYSVSSTGGTAQELAGTRGFFPRGLDLVKDNDQDMLYISGTDKNGVSGVWKTTTTGADLTAVATGTPLNDPSGVATTKGGVTYVADTLAAGGSAAILKIEGGKISTLSEGIRVGYPAGIALSADEKYLLVSALQPEIASAVVYRIDLATGDASEFSAGISQNTESAGVHRAHNADRYAWANSDDPDSAGTSGGTVFLIGTKANPLK